MPPVDDPLLAVLTRAQPFGPPTTDDIDGRQPTRDIYEPANDIDEIMRETTPVFLIGRRGSGKTTFLRAAHPFNELAVDLNSPELISQVGRTITALGINASGAFAERVAVIWKGCFITALCARLHGDYCELNETKSPDAYRFGAVPTVSSDGAGTDAATLFLLRLREAATTKDWSSLASMTDNVELNEVPLWVARQDLDRAAKRAGCRAIVSLDSLDQYTDIFDDSGFYVTSDALALQGLFRAAATIGRDVSSVYKVRVSFPAELWHFYSDLSSNPLKDFDNSIALHWDGKELLHLAGVRLLKFIQLHEPAEYRRIDHGQGGGSSWAQELLLRYLPARVRNGLGKQEPTISYLLRHTQLLPRHLIYVLNATFGNRDFVNRQVTGSEVVKAVRVAEPLIVKSITDSYKLVYPDLVSICKRLIKALPTMFTGSELQSAIVGIDTARMENADVMQMLVEVGVVGRRTEETKDYAKADFEYLHEHRLLMTAEDPLCLHPLFTEVYDSQVTRQRFALESPKPVYPLGSDPAGDDTRRVIHLTRDLDR